MSAESTWAAIAERRFADWRGLPDSPDYAEFSARFPRLVDASARGFLGDRAAMFASHGADGYPHPLTAWFDDDVLVLLDAPLPDLSDDLRAVYGEPAARLDFWWDVMEVPGGAHVYPDRGVTLYLEDRTLVRLSLFTPCDIDTYLRTLWPDTTPVELPDDE